MKSHSSSNTPTASPFKNDNNNNNSSSSSSGSGSNIHYHYQSKMSVSQSKQSLTRFCHYCLNKLESELDVEEEYLNEMVYRYGDSHCYNYYRLPLS